MACAAFSWLTDPGARTDPATLACLTLAYGRLLTIETGPAATWMAVRTAMLTAAKEQANAAPPVLRPGAASPVQSIFTQFRVLAKSMSH